MQIMKSSIECRDLMRACCWMLVLFNLASAIPVAEDHTLIQKCGIQLSDLLNKLCKSYFTKEEVQAG